MGLPAGSPETVIRRSTKTSRSKPSGNSNSRVVESERVHDREPSDRDDRVKSTRRKRDAERQRDGKLRSLDHDRERHRESEADKPSRQLWDSTSLAVFDTELSPSRNPFSLSSRTTVRRSSISHDGHLDGDNTASGTNETGSKSTKGRRQEFTNGGMLDSIFGAASFSTSKSRGAARGAAPPYSVNPSLPPSARSTESWQRGRSSSATAEIDGVAQATAIAAMATTTGCENLLHPRVAVALGIPPKWHYVLFVCRLLSIAPACWLGLPFVFHVLMKLGALWVYELQSISMAATKGTIDKMLLKLVLNKTERRVLFTEVTMSLIWIGAAAYLSFFFIDCLLSRWLLTYTPQATVIRLITISALNALLMRWILYLAGGMEDARLLLPSWIGITTTLTILYHITQRKINIRKETSASMTVFSVASFISMVCLLIQIQLDRDDFPTIPIIEGSQRLWSQLIKWAVKALEYSKLDKIAAL